ncbi:MAG: type II toxin-antitoxin system VapC family toxin [Promethearchaeia archaeon]
MKEIVVDANVIVKWYIEEKNSEQAQMLQMKFIERELDLIVPSLFYFEVLNALKYSNLFIQQELNQAGESLENYGFTIITIEKEIRKQMVKIAINHDISIYDAAYIALSIMIDKPLFTADEKIKKKLPPKLKKHVKHLDESEQFLNK